jgi:hypothetical protein
MGFNSAFKGLIHSFQLTVNLLTTTIVAPPSNASKWQMGFNSAFKGLIHSFQLTLNMLTTTIIAPPSNASNWPMGFNSAFKRLIRFTYDSENANCPEQYSYIETK